MINMPRHYRNARTSTSRRCCPFAAAWVLRRALCIVCMGALSLGQLAEAVTIIEADHPDIRYTGRIDHEDPKAPTLWWPGSDVTACFEGTSIGVTVHDYGDNYFYAIVDGGPPILVDLTLGYSTYTIAEGLRDREHTVTFFKRTETAEGKAAFHGFVLDPGKSLLPMPARPKRRIEFYGDSITSGHSVASTTGDSNKADAKDNYYAYAGVAARDLGAEYHCISVSGIGLFVDVWGFGGNMQSMYYDRLGPSKRWGFDQWTPHLVVVNLGQNDAWGPHKAEDATANYVGFAKTLRRHYPDTHILLCLGSMQASENDSPWPGYLHEAVATLKNEHNDQRIYGLIFPYTGDAHPSAQRHQTMAKQLTAFIKDAIPGFDE